MLDELADECFSVSASNAIPNSDIVTAANNHNTVHVRKGSSYTPNANMADHSVVARDELHESEVS